METWVAKIAVAELKAIRAHFAAYDEYTREMAKQRLAPQYCVHGTNLWTSYDPMCGECEEGESYFDYTVHGRIAITKAERRVAQYDKRMSIYTGLVSEGRADIAGNLLAWVAEPLKIETNSYLS